MEFRKLFEGMTWRDIKLRFKIKGRKIMKNVNAYNRLYELYLRGLGVPRKEVADKTGFSEEYITALVAKCKKFGLDAVLEDRRTSNNRRMTYAEEEKFLEQFVDSAESGQIITVGVILSQFEKETGKASNTSTIYALLKRHGWRKVRPRPQHPGKANDADIDAAKKLTLKQKGCWKIFPKRSIMAEL